jgi:plasmid maintenance system antidote protein VapI
MTALQLQRLLDRAGLSQRGAAKALEINERTMRKYCAGDSKIPKTVEYAIQWVCSTAAKESNHG